MLTVWNARVGSLPKWATSPHSHPATRRASSIYQVCNMELVWAPGQRASRSVGWAVGHYLPLLPRTCRRGLLEALGTGTQHPAPRITKDRAGINAGIVRLYKEHVRDPTFRRATAPLTGKCVSVRKLDRAFRVWALQLSRAYGGNCMS